MIFLKTTIPEFPEMNEPYPVLFSSWFKAEYRLKTIKGIKFIETTDEYKRVETRNINGFNVWVTADNCKPVEEYDLLSDSFIEPTKQPQRREDHDYAPHLHLMHLNTDKPKEILKFVNKWGLLGLQVTNQYKYYPETYDEANWKRATLIQEGQLDKWIIERDLKKDTVYYPDKKIWESEYGMLGNIMQNMLAFAIRADKVSAAILQNAYIQLWRACFREPLHIFIEATKQFQDTAFKLLDKEDTSNYERAINTLNSFINQCSPNLSFVNNKLRHRWKANSLIEICYLLLYSDLSELNEWVRCKYDKCRRLHKRHKGNSGYCSISCRKTAKRMDYYTYKNNKDKGGDYQT